MSTQNILNPNIEDWKNIYVNKITTKNIDLKNGSINNVSSINGEAFPNNGKISFFNKEPVIQQNDTIQSLDDETLDTGKVVRDTTKFECPSGKKYTIGQIINILYIYGLIA